MQRAGVRTLHLLPPVGPAAGVGPRVEILNTCEVGEVDVYEVYNAMSHVRSRVQDVGLIAKYDALLGPLHVHAQPNQQKPAFEAQRDALFEAVRTVVVDALSVRQQNLLKSLGMAEIFGTSGVAAIEEILYRNQLDPATAHKRLTALRTKTVQAFDSARQFEDVLRPIVPEQEQYSSDEVVVRLVFDHESGITNMSQLRAQAEAWFHISRGFTLAAGGSPEDIRIVAAHQGSLLLDILGVPAVVLAMVKAVDLSLSCIQRYLDIVKVARELRDSGEDDIADMTEQRAEERLQAASEEISKEIGEMLTSGDTLDGEQEQALHKAVKHLVRFVRNGGGVDYVAKPSEADIGEHGELVETLQRVRALESELASQRLLVAETDVPADVQSDEDSNTSIDPGSN